MKELKTAEEIMREYNCNDEPWLHEDDVIGAMEDFAAQFKNEWVSVDDVKANYYENVLVTNGKSIYIAWLAVNDSCNYTWTIFGTDVIANGITHWKPLPSPPSFDK